jgi:hypothetical protein
VDDGEVEPCFGIVNNGGHFGRELEGLGRWGEVAEIDLARVCAQVDARHCHGTLAVADAVGTRQLRLPLLRKT